MIKPMVRNNNRREKTRANIASGAPFVWLGSTLALFLFLHLTVFSPLSLCETGLLGALNQNNILKYLVALVVLALSFLALRYITGWIPRKASETLFFTPMPHWLGRAFFVAGIGLLGAFLMRYLFYTELYGDVYGAAPEILIWHHLPIALIVGYVGAVLLLVLVQAFRDRKGDDLSAYVSYFIAILISYFTFLFINTNDPYHAVAYTESIYNVYSGIPYNLVTTGIYGHYGIFLGGLLRLFHGNSVMLSHMIAIVGALSTAACAYIIHHVTSKNYIRIPAILATLLSVAVLRYKNYWQLQPHRILFPLLTVALLTYLAKHGSYTKAKIFLGYLLCTVAVIWNTESGMFCAVAYTLALIIHFYQTERWYSKKMWLRYALLLGATASTLIAAILFVNFYNLLVGGEWILKDFFFPLGVDTYMNGFLKVDLPRGTQVWILVFLLFLALLFLGVYHTVFFQDRAEKRGGGFDAFAPVFVALSVVSLLNISYFMNRAAYFNLDICSQSACVAMAIFADRFLGDWRAVFRQKVSFVRGTAAVLSLASLLILTAMATQIVFAADPLSRKYNEGVWDTELLETRTEEFAEIVPEDYMVLGVGASTYALQLNRIAPYGYRDFSDLTVGGDFVVDTIVQDALAYGKIAFCFEESHEDTKMLMERILEEGNFVLTAEGTVGSFFVQCYELQK